MVSHNVMSSLVLIISCLFFLIRMGYSGSVGFEDSFMAMTGTDEMLSMMRDELKNLRMDLTKSFVADHTRRRRDALGFTYEARISESNPTFQTRIDSTGHTSCVFQHQILIFKNDGIYKLVEHSSKSQHELVKVSEWSLEQGDEILHTYEWEEDTLFILTSSKNGSYSRLSTLQAPDFILIPRQQIKNDGIATAAQFFPHLRDLCLVIAIDDALHSLAVSRIYCWVQTYMDGIHEIHTRGASAVLAFSVNSYTYIAIAQSQDAAGNFEVGTLLVRMYGRGGLEKVQVLWSYDPVALSHFRIMHEDYLIIAQRNMPSISYWFGGYDFTFWEAPESHFGRNIFLDSLTLPDGEPLVLAVNERTVKFITRASSRSGPNDLALNSTNIVYSAEPSEKIVHAQFLKSATGISYLGLTVLQNSARSTGLKIFEILFAKIEIGKSREKDREDKLSDCLTKLKNRLDHDDPDINRLEGMNDFIITRNKDVEYTGSVVVSQGAIILPSRNTFDSTAVQPDIPPNEKYTLPPSQLLALGNNQIRNFDTGIKPQLDKVLLKSVPGNVTGDKSFTKSLSIKNLHSFSKIELETLNKFVWSDIENQFLFHSEPLKHQRISGHWKVRTLSTDNFQGVESVGDIRIDDFLLRSCGNSGKQIIHGEYIFKVDVHFNKGLQFGPFAKINDILFSDIVLRSRLHPSGVRGFKHADFINGGDGFEALKVNGLNLKEWYDSTLKIDGKHQFSTGLKSFSNLRRINSVQVLRLNNRNWDEFLLSVLISGPNQTIQGDVDCKQLMVAVLNAETINSKLVKDLFTTTTDQEVTSDITVSELKLRNIETGTVNAIVITDAVRTSENAEIQGQVQLEKFTVTNVMANDEVTISSVDVSEAAKLRKTHIYRTANSEPVHIRSGDVGTVELHSSALNGIEFEGLHNSFWRVDAQNEIPGNFDFGGAVVLATGEFTTTTLNGLNLRNDIVTTKENDAIDANLQFDQAVTATDDIDFLDGVTMNRIDFLELSKQIIRTTDADGRHITGHKHFQDTIEVNNGLIVKEVNGKILEKDVVLLKYTGHQRISGAKKFQDVSAGDVTSAADVKVTGTVNGENLKSIADTTAYHDQPVNIKGNVIFKNGIDAQILQVENAINQKPFEKIVSHSIDLSKGQTISIPLTIEEGTLKFSQNAIVHDINGIRPDEYLGKVVNKNSDAVIHGTKEFRTLALEANLEGCTKVNELDLLELEKTAFSKTVHQTITGKIHFQEVHTNGNLETEKIGGVSLTNLAQTNEKSHIASNVEFTGKETRFNDEIRLTGLFNGYKIEEVAEGLKMLRGNRQFHTVIVDGNLSWKNSKVELERLSHLYENSVTTYTDQTLSRKITFASNLIAHSIHSDKWINDIDLKKIQEDGVFRDQSTTFTGQSIFLQPLKASGSVEVNRKLSVNLINSISLEILAKQVVRSDSTTQTIRGMKTLENGFHAKHITVEGTIDNIHPKDLVVKGDERTVDRITLTDAKITNDLNYETLHGDKLNEILNQRVSLNEIQTLLGNYVFESDVVVKECFANPINGIFKSDVFLKDSQFLQHIRGKKTFRDLKIDGDIHGTTINGISLNKVNSQIFNLDQNEVFDRPVIFHDTIHVKDVNVTNGINTFDFEEAKVAFSTQLKEIVEPIHVSKSTREQALYLIDQLGESVNTEGFWFDNYVVPKKFLNTQATRVEYFIPEDKSHVKIALHRQVPVGENMGKWDLPKECLCKHIHLFELDKNVVTKIEPLIEGVNVYNVRAPSGTAYTVISDVISYNATCTSKSERGVTKILSGKIEDLVSLGEIEFGYLGDVKAFGHDGKDYLALAQLYNPQTKSHKADVQIYEVSNGRLKLVQAIHGNGATRLALDKYDKTWILAVANSRAGSAPEDCRTTSEIYFWSTESAKFVHVKNVDTVGAVDVIILNVLKYTEPHDSFVIFAENDADTEESRNLGKVTIYAYEKPQTPAYSLFQTLEFNTPVSAVYGISIQKIAYLFVVTNSKIIFYKYLHFEGFQKWGSIQIDGAMDTNVILWQEELYFLVASTENSLLARAITSGSPN